MSEEILTRRQKRFIGRRQKRLYTKAMSSARHKTSKQLNAMRPEKGDNWFCPKHGKVPTVHQHYRGNVLVCGLCEKKARKMEDVEILTNEPPKKKVDIWTPEK